MTSHTSFTRKSSEYDLCYLKGLNPGVINFISKLNMIVRMSVVLKGLFLTVTVSTTCAVVTVVILTTAQMT